MKRILALVVVAICVLSTSAQKYKVLDSSEKKRPSWVGVSGDGIIAITCQKETMEDARQACMNALRQEVIMAIATNIVSETSTKTEQITTGDDIELTDEFRENTTVQSAVLPFLSDLAISKAKATYWEKIQDKTTKNITYVFSLCYPFSETTRQKYVEQFAEIDRNMVQKTEALDRKLNDITSIDDIDRGSIEIKECASYFFDKRRKQWAEGIYALYQKAPSKISVHGEQESEDTYRIWLEFCGRKITPTVNPTLSSDCAENLRFKKSGNDFFVTFSTENCLEDEPRSIQVGFRIKSKSLKEKFVIE